MEGMSDTPGSYQEGARPPLPPSPTPDVGGFPVTEQQVTEPALPEPPTKLTIKQARFCREYHTTGNATLSARRAGYSEKCAASIGSENLQKPEIRAYLELLEADEKNRYVVTQGKLIHHLSMQAMADRRGFYDEDGAPIPIHELPEDLAAALDGVKVNTDGTVTPVLVPRRVAQEALARHLGIYEADNTQRGAATAEEAANIAEAGNLELARRLAWLLTQAATQTQES